MVAGVDGAFLTGDIFNLYVWFEVFLIASFGLLILDGTRAADRRRRANMPCSISSPRPCSLIATGLAYGAFGTLNMADIARKARGARRGRAADNRWQRSTCSPLP